MKTVMFAAAMAAALSVAATPAHDGPYTQGTWTQGQYAQQIDSRVGLFPNPAADQVNVIYPGLKGDATVCLLAPDGRVLRQVELGETGNAHTVLDLGGLPGGIYLVRVLQPKGTDFTQRLVVSR